MRCLMAMMVLICGVWASVEAIQKPPTELLAPFKSQSLPTTISLNSRPKPSLKTLPAVSKPTAPPSDSSKNVKITAAPVKKKEKVTQLHNKPVTDVKISKRSQSNDGSNNEILHFEKTEDLNGVYYFNYKTENGISHEERGGPRHLDDKTNDISEHVEGEYSYVAPDGTEIVVNYIANENGFQPLGSHIPTPPPIPESIQRALLYIQSLQP